MRVVFPLFCKDVGENEFFHVSTASREVDFLPLIVETRKGIQCPTNSMVVGHYVILLELFSETLLVAGDGSEEFCFKYKYFRQNIYRK